MLLDEKMLVTLQKLGLTYYGSRVYATLVSLGPSDATELASESEVPRTKIYDVLRRLKTEKWITAEHTRPIKYTAKYPKDVIEERKAAFNSEIDEVSNQLSELYDKLIDNEIPKVWLLRGMNNITAKTLDMIRRAKKDIMLLGALYSENEIEQLKTELLYATKKGLNIRVISRQSIKLKDGELDIIKNLSSIIPKIKISGPAFSKFVIIDDKELLIVFSKVEDDILDIDTTIAIWIPNVSIASYQASIFNGIWNE
ncbi:MAG: HTH-type transcriptional regulator, sugar sensing transcriptional regulator [Euryarchaeota archaeon]|nr:HTH-type transcriptional regulator, sugar sensing transcriptional regulator [Euryarchaeota archaeon]